jgi:hypothetical protein
LNIPKAEPIKALALVPIEITQIASAVFYFAMKGVIFHWQCES